MAPWRVRSLSHCRFRVTPALTASISGEITLPNDDGLAAGTGPGIMPMVARSTFTAPASHTRHAGVDHIRPRMRPSRHRRAEPERRLRGVALPGQAHPGWCCSLTPLVDLPLTLLLGLGSGILVPDELGPLEIAIQANMPARTDAALGRRAQTPDRYPPRCLLPCHAPYVSGCPFRLR